ncbi:DUF6602 domain-containing protein [Dyella mobilis]|uniref:DUF6602 domain-containing protein n=1 Tax=Dyella mobilis TaxID=1849582 RepID=A0ABS2KC99_9GAMM|nr:DUF6602 domain-containing protein [Dyella mobilis]MBM7128729.1 hypothetical protein [Dyella mobilis]GLQ99056.1 hypothetical protein GCM10007863_34760 [Dyella mobilis]
MPTHQEPKSDTDWMRSAFVDVQAELALKLKRAFQSIEHAGTKGAVNEDHWIEILRAYLPRRYEVSSGIVIDSQGGHSDQIDIVVFDHQYTPTLLDQQKHRYIPAEAVYAVLESKPHFDKDYLVYAGQKAASVRKLHRTSVAISHAGGTYPPKPHASIVSGIVAARSSWADGLGGTFHKNLPADALELLDCGCALEHGAFDTFDGELKIVGSEGALIYFLFRLLSKLQSLGTVPAIDWAAYAAIIHR